MNHFVIIQENYFLNKIYLKISCQEYIFLIALGSITNETIDTIKNDTINKDIIFIISFMLLLSLFSILNYKNTYKMYKFINLHFLYI
ncbi:hypothetical protein CPG38_01315 [Malaciobacter marinus]|uniref:Uncharacterized protein n=1 Tax=Malaciobacter marinus TaxID=505249 RepID=A0ABX4M090_9BACT|nr:hypothetical protein CPG38_01315 [Malaciobacter marinus]PHO16257.1 hypothetical protein CPH92_02855 [Malaciobacter marinus]